MIFSSFIFKIAPTATVTADNAILLELAFKPGILCDVKMLQRIMTGMQIFINETLEKNLSAEFESSVHRLDLDENVIVFEIGSNFLIKNPGAAIFIMNSMNEGADQFYNSL